MILLSVTSWPLLVVLIEHLKYLFIYLFLISNDYLTFVTLAWSTKPVLSHWGIFVAIANNILYGLKLYIFLLCQKSLAY